MNKIISNFYLIRVGGKPSYVGYTNRSIKTRFREHLKDKDFGDDLVELENLGALEYDFTWDMELINSYAREVSSRETELIVKYSTKDSIWQKGLGDAVGGQTWANVKNFVNTNRDNPKFSGLSEEDIIAYLETSDKVSRYMKDFVHDMGDPVAVYMKNFVSNMDDPVAVYMKNFASNMDDPVSSYMKDFVHDMGDPVLIYMKNFVNNMHDPVSKYMSDFVSNMDDPVSIYMKNFVNHMDDPISRYMKDFVGNMNKQIDGLA